MYRHRISYCSLSWPALPYHLARSERTLRPYSSATHTNSRSMIGISTLTVLSLFAPGHDLLSRLKTINHVQRLRRRHQPFAEAGRKVLPFVLGKDQYIPAHGQTDLTRLTRQGDELQWAS